MSENVATKDSKETTNAVKTKRRRGISNETKSVSQLKFHEKDATSLGLFLGHLEEAIVDWRTLKDDVKGMPSFAGLAIPRFVLHFESNHQNVDERRHAYITLLPVESNVDTIPGGQHEWRVNNIFSMIKHVLSVFYLKGRPFTEAEEDALTLTFEDFDENGEYVSVAPEDVIKGYQIVFENAIAMLNGSFNLADGQTAKPCFRDANGKPLLLWMKLLRCVKSKGEWSYVGQNGELAFPNIVGEGIIEIAKTNEQPRIVRFNPIRESITPKEIKKAPNIGGVGAGIPGIAPGVGTIPGIGGFGGFDPSQGFDGGASNAAFSDANKPDDLPF